MSELHVLEGFPLRLSGEQPLGKQIGKVLKILILDLS